MTKEEAIKCEAYRIQVDEKLLRTFIHVESGGTGFNSDGKLIIQFEPHHFKNYAKNEYTKYIRLNNTAQKELTQVEKQFVADFNIVLANKISDQPAEYKAFNAAFRINKTAAMLSTSIGLGQVMGFNHKRLGYITVDEMWDDAKKGEDRQVFQMVEFINTDSRLKNALKEKNWHLVATYYNGAGYKELAQKHGFTPYDIRMRDYYNKL